MTLMSLFAAAVLAVAPAEECEVKQGADQIAGAWKIEYTTPDYEDVKAVVLLGRQRDALVAWRVTDEGRQAFDKAQLEGETLVLTIKPQEYSGDVTATLKAQLNGAGVCRGVIQYKESYGDSGQIDLRGQKIELDQLDNVSQWKLDFVGPDDVRRQPLVTAVTYKNEHYAWYSGSEFDLPAMKLVVDGDSATMKIAATAADGEKVDVTFRGKLDGDSVAGEATWRTGYDSGSFAFKGVRKK